MPIRALAPWIVVAVIFLTCGMTWVHFKNKSVTCGREIKKLEKELADLNNELATLRPKINQLCSRTTLQARLDDGLIKMIPIKQDRIVQVGSARENDLRTVSNERTGQ